MSLPQANGRRPTRIGPEDLDAGPKVPRHRLTRAEQAELDDALIKIVMELHPITVRGVFYQAEVLIPHISFKDQKGYGIVQRRLVTLRAREVIPYACITDGTRWRHGYRRYNSLAEGQADFAQSYRRNYWRDSPVHVEVWIEKDALAGTIFPTVVEEWGLDLMVARGFASKTYLYEAASYLVHVGKESHIYLLSDFDPSGKCAADTIGRDLRQFAKGKVKIHVHDLAVTKAQIRGWNLPTRPTKTSDKRARKFIAKHGDRSVELDAIRPDRFRQLVSDAIAKHADLAAIEHLKFVEAQEREQLASFRNLQQVDDA
jgi:hypothetical protein